jgi:amino acid adenylation domain-containing protein
VLTYAELDRLSLRIARALADAGIGRGDRVGLCLPKSERAVAAMLGASRAGAAYVPVDPAAPAVRGAFILRDCAVRALVTTSRKLKEYRDELAGIASIALIIIADDLADAAETGDIPAIAWTALPEPRAVKAATLAIETDPAYLLYTSGSTGHPKGVILSHRHARTFVDWGRTTFDVGPDDRLSNHAPHHFDLSVFDIYVALAAGACVVIVTDEVAAFPIELARWIGRQRITVWYSVPSALIRMLLHGRLADQHCPDLRTVLFAGEVFPMKYLREVMTALPSAAFANLYGPTETNVCTWYPVPHDLPDDATEIPIGFACANTDVFAIDDDGRPVQPGGTGELFVRGPTVLHGYWGLPDRTRAALVPNPLQTAYYEPAYRTGDIVRLDEDDLYWFVGRRDHMVKSRGYRIELGEVEQAIYLHTSVREAVVLAVPDDEVGARLHAFVAPVAGATLEPRDVNSFCAARLPRYMVPESFTVRDELPKTSTGKIDRVALRNAFLAPPQEANA